MDRDIAKIKADKVYTLLVLSNIEYEDIKQLVLENTDLSSDETSKELGRLIASKGITRMYEKEEVQRQCIEHFQPNPKNEERMEEEDKNNE